MIDRSCNLQFLVISRDYFDYLEFKFTGYFAARRFIFREYGKRKGEKFSYCAVKYAGVTKAEDLKKESEIQRSFNITRETRLFLDTVKQR